MYRHGVNSFVNSIASSFGLAGNKADTIKEYIPAVAFTLYDGYYIYSPYENTNYLYDSSNNPVDKNGETFHGLKPYIYYSARYKQGIDDFVITYTLDSFITIQGMVNGNYVNDSGYIIDPSECTNNADGTITYRGAKIGEETLTENYANPDSTGTQKIKQYSYYKYNGTKYYYDSDTNEIFYILNGKKLVQYKNSTATNIYNTEILHNQAAIKFYTAAKTFTNKVLGSGVGSYDLSGLNAKDAYATDGTTKMFPDEDYRIFGQNGDCKNVEYSNSTFNQQRLSVIRYTIETNLSTAISGFKQYSNSTTDYVLPKIKENEWDIILNHVSVISFLQGINIGSKEYNGYAIVVNNKNKEVVSEESIYINTNDTKYHRVNDNDLNDSNVTTGSLVIDYERNSFFNTNTNETLYFCPRSEIGCYKSIVNQYNTVSYVDLYRYMDTLSSAKLKSAYFSALGRERYTMYRIGESVTK